MARFSLSALAWSVVLVRATARLALVVLAGFSLLCAARAAAGNLVGDRRESDVFVRR